MRWTGCVPSLWTVVCPCRVAGVPQIDGDGEFRAWIMLDDSGSGPWRGERLAADGTETGSDRSLGKAMVDEAPAVFEGEALDEGERQRVVKSSGCQADRLVGGRREPKRLDDRGDIVHGGELLAGRHWPSFVMPFTLGAEEGAVHST